MNEIERLHFKEYLKQLDITHEQLDKLILFGKSAGLYFDKLSILKMLVDLHENIKIKDNTEENIKTRREELNKISNGISILTADKTAFCELNNGYEISGFVLKDKEGRRGIIEGGAVRWLSKDEMWKLMHPDL